MSLEPFLKWAGGKRWLMRSAEFQPPREYNRYIEPFLGSGAAFFHLCPQAAFLSDLNKELINLYIVLRQSPNDLWSLMTDYQERHSSGFYYYMRECIPACSMERAARTLYLNRTCWNGLYRVNLRGRFNVPKGTKDRVVFDDDDFEVASELLQRAEIRCVDFQEALSHASDGDFVFVDPPYTANHNENGFLKYNERIFSWKDQVRLRDAVKRAAERGAKVIVTNADHQSIVELYKDFGRCRSLARHSILAGDKAHRRPTTEALIEINVA